MTTKWKNTGLTRMITVGFAMGICEESDTWRIVEEKEKGTRQREWYLKREKMSLRTNYLIGGH